VPTNPIPLPDVRAVTYDLWLTLLQDADPASTRDARVRALAQVLPTSYGGALQLLVEARSALHAGWERGRAQTVSEIAEGVVRSSGRELGEESSRRSSRLSSKSRQLPRSPCSPEPPPR